MKINYIKKEFPLFHSVITFFVLKKNEMKGERRKEGFI